MLSDTPQGDPRWAPAPASLDPRYDNPLHRFLGGSPVGVAMRLLLLSLFVGALLMWLDIQPYQIFEALRRFVERLWDLGFDAIRQVAIYIVAGAVLVVPAWLIIRLLSVRPR